MKPSLVRKRSIRISGRNTSISLEDDFWDLAKDMARRRGVSVEILIDGENLRRAHGNLSSCVRRLVLRDLHDRLVAADARLLTYKAN